MGKHPFIGALPEVEGWRDLSKYRRAFELR